MNNNENRLNHVITDVKHSFTVKLFLFVANDKINWRKPLISSQEHKQK